MRFNNLLGISDAKMLSNTIEGGETRRLESYNASMTTATLTFTDNESNGEETETKIESSDQSGKSNSSDMSDKSDQQDVADSGTTELTLINNVTDKIGRASCRERV